MGLFGSKEEHKSDGKSNQSRIYEKTNEQKYYATDFLTVIFDTLYTWHISTRVRAFQLSYL